MMNQLKPPAELSFEGNLAENFKRFKQKFNLFMMATTSDKKPEPVKVAILLSVMGDAAIEKYNTFGLSNADKDDLNKVLQAFENYCMPKTNESVERHIFFNRNQKVQENFDEYVTELKKLSSSCQFGAMKDSLIKDRIISGIRDSVLKDKLLNIENITLEKCIQIGRRAELTKQHLTQISGEKTVMGDVSWIEKKRPENNKWVRKSESQKYSHNYNNGWQHGKSRNDNGKPFDKNKYQNKYSRDEQTFKNKCGRCGRRHENRCCPAFDLKCRKCSKRGHFAKYCRTKNINYVGQDQDEYQSDEPDDARLLGSIQKEVCIIGVDQDWYEEVTISDQKIRFKLDTGAQVNVLPIDECKRLNLKIEEKKTRLTNYNGSSISVMGRCTTKAIFKTGKYRNLTFEVVKTANEAPPILGLPTIIREGLIKRIETIDLNKCDNYNFGKYQSLFDRVGDINYVYKIKLDPKIQPCIEPCRKIAYSLMEPLKAELDAMEEMEVIKKVKEPSEWVNAITIVKKSNNKIRLCLDPFWLNQAIERERYTLPTFEDLVSKMPGATVFSILDGYKGFWHIRLAEESQLLTTFNTPYGRYCFRRLPFGICSAPEVFHRCFLEVFEGLPGIELYIDDLIVWGTDKKEHDSRLHAVLQRAKDRNVTFNKSKCKFGVKEVNYVGHVFSASGLKPDPKKVQDILLMKEPKCKTELATFLGMVTYVARFIPNLSQITQPLRELLKKQIEWTWLEIQEKAFKDIKKQITQAPILQYYNRNKPIVLTVDASQHGLGAAILQDQLPVAYASKALTDCQKSYSQIEKELLAIVHGCDRFHQYIYGTRFTVESDHLPLQAIFRKPLHKCPLRLQRMLIKLQPYSFQVIYKPGKFMYIADALSRSHGKETYVEVETDIEAQVSMISELLPMTPIKKKLFQSEVETDEEMNILKTLIINGWNRDKHLLPNEAKPYHTFSEELFLCDGLIFKGSQLIVPKSLRADMIERIHYHHLGMTKCKQRAREYIFWPEMNKHIEDRVSNCSICTAIQRRNQKEELIPTEIPEGPWKMLAADIYELADVNYLIVIDYFSKFVEVITLPNLLCETTVKMLKSTFARFGIPDTLVTDNGPQFSAKRFKEFAKEWNFDHRTTSPHYATANGMVERHIQTVKNMIIKILEDKRDPYLALLEFRNTSINHEIASPAELLIGRKLNGLLPNWSPVVRKQEPMEQVRNNLEKRQQQYTKYYNRGAKSLKPLQPGDIVNMENYEVKRNLPLNKGKVLEAIPDRPRSYQVLQQNGNIVRRNRRHLFKNSSKEPFEIDHTRPGHMDGEIDNAKEPFDIDNTRSGHVDGEISEKHQGGQKDEGSGSKEHIEPATETISRAGRTVRKPSYLKDYITD